MKYGTLLASILLTGITRVPHTLFSSPYTHYNQHIDLSTLGPVTREENETYESYEANIHGQEYIKTVFYKTGPHKHTFNCQFWKKISNSKHETSHIYPLDKQYFQSMKINYKYQQNLNSDMQDKQPENIDTENAEILSHMFAEQHIDEKKDLLEELYRFNDESS